MTELLTVAFWLTAGVQDVRRRKISWKIFAAFGTGAILFQFFIKQEPWGSWIGGIALGGLLLGIGFVTREAIGYGDGLAVMVTGMLLGFWRTAEAVLAAFFLAAVVSAVLLAAKKAGRKYGLPFLPFLGTGGALCLLAERSGWM